MEVESGKLKGENRKYLSFSIFTFQFSINLNWCGRNTRDQADSYAASKREEADIQAAAIVHKAGEEADAQIEERRAAAQSELDGLSKRIAESAESAGAASVSL